MNETKICEAEDCRKEYTRRRAASGRLEPGPTFRRRRFCSASCSDLNRESSKRRRVVEDVEFLIGTDYPLSIAKRVGYAKVRSLVRILEAADRVDLAERLSREHERYQAPMAVERDRGPWVA
jgi:hypothetical protein